MSLDHLLSPHHPGPLTLEELCQSCQRHPLQSLYCLLICVKHPPSSLPSTIVTTLNLHSPWLHWSFICRVLVFSMLCCRDFKTQKMQSILLSKKLFFFFIFFLDQAQSDCNCHRNHSPHFWFALVRRGKLFKMIHTHQGKGDGSLPLHSLVEILKPFFPLEYCALIVKMDFTWWWRGLKMPFSYTFHHYPSEHLLKTDI